MSTTLSSSRDGSPLLLRGGRIAPYRLTEENSGVMRYTAQGDWSKYSRSAATRRRSSPIGVNIYSHHKELEANLVV